MEKIICDICGTSYPETEDNCPICGCSKDFGVESFENLFDDDGAAGFQSAGSRKPRSIFDYDEVNSEEEPELPEEDGFDDEEEYEEEPQSNTALVVILVVLIVLLLLVAGFFFLKYFLPNIMPEEEVIPVVTTEAVVETTEETQDPSVIPCTDLSIPGGKVELAKDGKWLLNVQVIPENSTDELRYTSADESIATVSEDGTVTAVGEGKTTIIIVCGSRQINCNVTVDYSLETETKEEGTLPGLTVEATEEPAETTAEEQPKETEAAEETKAAEETEAPKETADPNAELKLKKDDITIFSNHMSINLELENEIPMDQIKWFTMDSTVAIVHNGVVTSTGSGLTRIYGEYKGQQVVCIIRCQF